MRTTAIGIAMLNDEREHVWSQNNAANMEVVNRWADVIRKNLINEDGSAAEVVVASKIITSVRDGQQVGEELVRKGVKQVIMCYNVWNFPFLCWPFINCFGEDVPILSLSNNNGKYPGNVGLLATDGALRQAGRRTHRIVGEMDSAKTQQDVHSTGSGPPTPLQLLRTRSTASTAGTRWVWKPVTSIWCPQLRPWAARLIK